MFAFDQTLFGGLSTAQFLADYWQQRPLIVRNAWPGFTDPIDPETLAGLACENVVESRLVHAPSGNSRWEVRYGPFEEQDFLSLTNSDWSLLVQDVDQMLPEVAELTVPFRFLPSWRFDDVMVSYSTTGGGVGPHWDEYDVFLLQGRGKRRWQISDCLVEDLVPAESNTAGLRLIDDFRATEQWSLNPGDLLYLPPKVAHYGVSLAPSLTYSIGFRAPTASELTQSFVDSLFRSSDGPRYRDAPNIKPEGVAVISDDTLNQVRAVVESVLASRDSIAYENWFGRWITESREELIDPPETVFDRRSLDQKLLSSVAVHRSPATRVAYRPGKNAMYKFFCGGRAWRLPGDHQPLIELLCSQTPLDGNMLKPWLKREPAGGLIVELINAGWFHVE